MSLMTLFGGLLSNKNIKTKTKPREQRTPKSRKKITYIFSSLKWGLILDAKVLKPPPPKNTELNYNNNYLNGDSRSKL